MNRDELMKELEWQIYYFQRREKAGEGTKYTLQREFLEGLKGLIERAERRYDELVETTGERIKQAEKEGK